MDLLFHTRAAMFIADHRYEGMPEMIRAWGAYELVQMICRFPIAKHQFQNAYNALRAGELNAIRRRESAPEKTS